MKTRLASSLLALSATSLLTVPASADPTLRVQVDQKGDFILIGNTVGQECRANPAVPAPIVGVVECAGNSNIADTAPDIFWRSEDDGTAVANRNVTVEQARSTAVLTLPPGATVTHAFLYWAGRMSFAQAPDTSVTVVGPKPSGPGRSTVTTAGVDNQPPVVRRNNTEALAWYQSVADVTALVKANGSGAYRVGGIGSVDLVDRSDDDPMAGWVMVVLYELASDPPRNLAIFDGLDLILNNAMAGVEVGLSGFLVPTTGFDAKLGVIAYEGEESYTGDSLLFNGFTLSNALNPSDNFFNSTRSFLGAAVSNAGDLPQLTGTANSMAGIDIDVVDVKSYVNPGDTSATIRATSNGDTYLLGAFVTSISTYAPNFSTSNKTFVDLNGGVLRPHDVIEYTIVATNSGNDTSINTVMTDPLPVGVTFVPGSISITSGANAGAKTDASGDDQAEYDPVTRTVKVRLGTGADATSGGSMAPGTSTTIKFQVTVDPGVLGSIFNQAIITGEGAQGAPATDYPTDGNGDGDGVPPTEVVVEECGEDSDCSSQKPFCDTSASPKVCVGCLTDDDCTSDVSPHCLPATNTCGCDLGPGNCAIDSDGDGLSDAEEEELGTDPNDADSDDDGVPDGAEIKPGEDTDGDGLINALDPDSDNDGLFDGTELGYDCDGPGTDATVGTCTPDADQGATTTDPLNWDTDGGGVSDGSEDFNLDGAIDPGETDPNDPSDDASVVDTDGDGLSDDLEDTIGTDPNDADSDDDGVLDGAEPNPTVDSDGDGLINALDPDSDDDGLFDGTELGYDCDGPGTDKTAETCIPDADGGATTTSPLNPDTDGGGVKDGDEDKNKNGAIDPGETDPNDPSDDNAGGDGGAGGTSGSGGSAASGGTSGSGGSAASGGMSGSGGSAASGGTDGDSGEAGESGTAGSGGTSPKGDVGSGGTPIVLDDGSIEGGGCACRAAGGGSYGSLGGWFAALAAAAVWRRRSKRLSSRG
jgi:clumping factor A